MFRAKKSLNYRRMNDKVNLFCFFVVNRMSMSVVIDKVDVKYDLFFVI